jgi:hypothetical protein
MTPEAIATIRQAAALLNKDAQDLREQCMSEYSWDDEDYEAMYSERVGTAAALLRMLA